MKEKLFVVILKYIESLDVIDQHLEAHLKYLDEYFANGTFLASGKQVPRSGGIILAKCDSRRSLYEILSKDPFHQALCAEYQVHEFGVNKRSSGFQCFLEEAGLVDKTIV